MNYRFPITLSLLVLLGSGCVSEKDRAQGSNEPQFSQKKECADIRPSIQKLIDEWNTGDQSAWLGIVFYSSKRNSCLYTMTVANNIGTDYVENHKLFDYFTNEFLENITGEFPEQDGGIGLIEATKKFNEVVSTYR